VADSRAAAAPFAETRERSIAHAAFHELLGPFVNGYAGCDRERWLRTIELVAREGEALPELERIYPRVAFRPREQWGARSAEIGAGLRELATYLRSNWAELEADRARNGADERFCR
jgi:hypothetical protein